MSSLWILGLTQGCNVIKIIWCVEWCRSLNFFPRMYIQFFQYHLLKNICLYLLDFLSAIVERQCWDYFCLGPMFCFFLLFIWFSLFGFILVLYWILISSSPNLFFRISLCILGTHLNVFIWILVFIKSYWYFLNILSPVIHESDISLHVLRSL